MAKNNQNQGDQEPASTPGPVEQQGEIYTTLTHSALLELIREARRDPRLEAQLEAEAARVKRRLDAMMRVVDADEKAKKQRQAACQHRKPNGEYTMGGQEFSDGRVRMFCLRCQVVLREYWTPAVAQGMAVASKMKKLGLTEEDIRESMEVTGVLGDGNPADDLHDDFQQSAGRSRHIHNPSLTT